MAATIFGLGLSQQFDVNGDPMSGAKLYLYQANTSTPVTSYSDFGLTSAQPWPLVADSTGRIPAFWLDDGDYRVRLTDADDVVVFDELDVTAIGPPEAAATPPTPPAVPDQVSDLTDYEEGSWTPTLTFSTPGNLAVPYSVRTATYIKVADLLFYSFTVFASPVTHTTASGNLLVTGFPHAASGGFFVGSCSFEGITLPAGRTQIQTLIDQGTTQAQFSTAGSAVGINVITTANVPTGGQVVLIGAGCYRTS